MQPCRGIFFLALLGISMVPLIVAPPEKEVEATGDGKDEGTVSTTAESAGDYANVYWIKKNIDGEQTEYQRAMKHQQFPNSHHHESVSERTDRLLVEAWQLLEEVKPYQRRFWLEVFAYFLENMLNSVKMERTVKKENGQPLNENPVSLAKTKLEHEESNMKAFATIAPQLERDILPPLPEKNTRSVKLVITAPEPIDYSLNFPAVTPFETSSAKESRLIHKSSKRDNFHDSPAIRESTETYKRQESPDVTAISEAKGPQESPPSHLYLETNIPQDYQQAQDTSEANTSHEYRETPEFSETSRSPQQFPSYEPRSFEKERHLSHRRKQRNAPENNQLQAVKLPFNNQGTLSAKERFLEHLLFRKKSSKQKIIDNSIEHIDYVNDFKHQLIEIDYVDEFKKELIEFVRFAHENAENRSMSVNESGTSLSTTTIKRNTSPLRDENPESTANGDQQKSHSVPQFSSSLPTSETVSDHAVPETQTVQVTSETQSTLPNKDSPTHDEEVPTTALIPSNKEKQDIHQDEEDELVRELEEIHKLARSHTTPTPSVKPSDSSTPATTVKRSSFVTDYQASTEDDKRKIEINMAKEIRELHSLGAKQEEIIKALGVSKQELPDGLKLMKIVQDADVQDSSAEKPRTLKNNHNTWKPYALPYSAPSYSSKPNVNDSFGGMHINLPTINNRFVTHHLQGGYGWGPYNARMRTNSGNLKHTLQKLERENYLLKTRLMSYTQPSDNLYKARGVTFPGTNRMNQFLPHEIRYPTELSLGENVQNSEVTPITPYPYITNSDLNNFTLQDIGKSSSLVSNPVTPNVNSEFSDEMKRQLRDGKVILLSDSVVRSNFEPEKEKDEGGEETKVIPKEVGETGIQAQN